MGLLNINGINNLQGAGFSSKTGETMEAQAPVSIMPTSSREPKKTSSCDDKYQDFSNALDGSRLKNGKLLGEMDLLFVNGFTKSKWLDKNGGTYYEKGDEKIRLATSLTGKKTVTYTNKNLSHFAVYNDKGKESYGVIQVRQSDGSIKAYNYEVDVEGNRYIKSISSDKREYFMDYDD